MGISVPNNPLASADNQVSGYDRARVGGSGFTIFTWNNAPLLYARQVSHQAPQAVGPGTTPIHPMDTPYPVELITPQATSMGTITIEFYELYGSNTWERLDTFNPGRSLPENLGNSRGPVDLVGIFKRVAEAARPIRMFKYIVPPNRPAYGSGGRMETYTEEFNNIVVSQLEDGETIEVGTMEILKRMIVNYTHVTRGGANSTLQAPALTNSGANSVNTPQGRYR